MWFLRNPNLITRESVICKKVKKGVIDYWLLRRSLLIHKLGRNYSTVSERHVEEIKIPVPWGHISGKWWGPKDGRPILCIHGWQDNANTFDTLVPLLPSENGYLAIDLPGHGFSSHFPKGVSYRVNEFVAVIRRIQNHYGWSKVSLVGHSLGSSLSFLFSSYFPEDVDLFVSIDLLRPVSWNASTDFPKIPVTVNKVLKNLTLDPEMSPSYDREELIKRHVKHSDDSLTEKSSEILLERGTKTNGEKLRLSRDPKLKTYLSPLFTHKELVKAAGHIRTNVLFVKAKSSPFYDRKNDLEETMEVLRKKAKVFEHHVLPGTHHMHLNTPEVLAPVICSFLEKTANDRK